MYNREIFWKFVELGLSVARVSPTQAIKALARVMRPEIDVFINGFETANLSDTADKAATYVQFVQGGPMPAWFVPFNNNWPE